MKPERIDFLKDILITAIEGGVNYWAEVKHYRPSLIQAMIIDTSSDDASEWKKYQIIAKTIQHGINAIIKNPELVCKDIRDAVTIASRDNDASDIDATIADCIIQAGLWDNVIYG